MNKLLQKIFISILLGLFILPAGLQAATSKKLHLVNQLKNHASPYLALHASDPVAWQDWSEKAVKLAKSQNKLLYLSIGYFSCHWCHVMQKESYKNPEIAAYLNKYFIPVKIDRELEPALDARLINFVERTRGMGGWPLNVFVTPDGYPLYAVLYEPAKNFKQVLVKLNDMWLNDRQQLKKLAREHVNNAKGPGAPKIDQAKVAAYTDKLVIGVRGYADSLNGGFGEQSKFPSVPQLSFLLHYIADSKNNKNRKNRARLKDILVLALDQMAMLGLRDHVGGGFFRYTVDPGWKTPHFEKMLYDNAQLASIYLQASQLLDRPDYLAVATDTLDFLQKEMKGKQGAYIAALSALDSRGIEGGYYLWSAAELKKYLSPIENKVYRLAWSIEDAPPFDEGYLPYAGKTTMQISKETGLTTKKVMSKLISAKIKLQKQRSKRVIPRDTKILAGWNGLALKAFSDAALITKNKKYQLAASKVRDHIVNHLWDGNSLKRSVVRGREVGRVALEDYAYVAQGLYAWASLTNKEADYQLLEKILKQAWIKFYGKRGWRLAEKSLIKTEGSQDVIADGVTPAPSALIAGLSLKVAARTKNEKLRNKALAALNSGHELVGRDPFWYASHVAALRDALSTNQQ
jgi:uncharacterized protein YyaL (SSP411 family)